MARYWPGEAYERLLKEAVETADSQHDAYKRVTVSAWPIRAYLERGSPPPAKRVLEKYTARRSTYGCLPLVEEQASDCASNDQ